MKKLVCLGYQGFPEKNTHPDFDYFNLNDQMLFLRCHLKNLLDLSWFYSPSRLSLYAKLFLYSRFDRKGKNYSGLLSNEKIFRHGDESSYNFDQAKR
jgi:hypothetical protein